MARIDRFTSRIDAEVACSVLVAHGFDAHLSTDDVGGLHPEIPYGIGGTVVVVPDEQYPDALALLDDQEPATVTVDEPPRPWPVARTLAFVVLVVVVVTLLASILPRLFG